MLLLVILIIIALGAFNEISVLTFKVAYYKKKLDLLEVETNDKVDKCWNIFQIIKL